MPVPSPMRYRHAYSCIAVGLVLAWIPFIKAVKELCESCGQDINVNNADDKKRVLLYSTSEDYTKVAIEGKVCSFHKTCLFAKIRWPLRSARSPFPLWAAMFCERELSCLPEYNFDVNSKRHMEIIARINDILCGLYAKLISFVFTEPCVPVIVEKCCVFTAEEIQAAIDFVLKNKRYASIQEIEPATILSFTYKVVGVSESSKTSGLVPVGLIAALSHHWAVYTPQERFNLIYFLWRHDRWDVLRELTSRLPPISSTKRDGTMSDVYSLPIEDKMLGNIDLGGMICICFKQMNYLHVMGYMQKIKAGLRKTSALALVVRLVVRRLIDDVSASASRWQLALVFEGILRMLPNRHFWFTLPGVIYHISAMTADMTCAILNLPAAEAAAHAPPSGIARLSPAVLLLYLRLHIQMAFITGTMNKKPNTHYVLRLAIWWLTSNISRYVILEKDCAAI